MRFFSLRVRSTAVPPIRLLRAWEADFYKINSDGTEGTLLDSTTSSSTVYFVLHARVPTGPDTVHFSDEGQRLVADEMANELIPFIEQQRPDLVARKIPSLSD